jgi:hypothetical protein
MKEWKNAMRLWCLAGEYEGMEDVLAETPTEEEFFYTLREYMGNAPSNWTGLADLKHSYHETDGYGFFAFGKLYIAIPEYDTYECHSGSWACEETLIEAVEMCQHRNWRQEEETRQFKNDINNYLSKL